jgi:hypothetical protein
MPTDTEQAMKRHRGDVRADGSIFWGYANYFRKDGGVTKMEKWISITSYENTMRHGKEWRLKNKARLKAYTKEYETKRRAKDPLFRLIKSMRSRMCGILGGKKDVGALALLGCSAQQLRSYLQAQFAQGMSWNNFGTYWHADHVIPLAWFDLSDTNQQRWAFHYTNLQPLTKQDNLRKNAKIAWRGCTAT